MENRFDTFFKAIYRYYPHAAKGTAKLSGIIYSFLETFLSSVGSLIILVLALMVEIHRFSIAISSFEEDLFFVTASALLLVVSLLFIETMIARTDFYAHKNGEWEEEKKYRFSLRYVLIDLLYFLGISKEFSGRKLPPSLQFRFLRNVIVIGTIFLATVGSLDVQITNLSLINEAQEKIVWYNALIQLVTTSDLSTFTTLISTLIFTYISVLVASKTSHQVVTRALESLHSLEEENRVVKEAEAQKMTMLIKDLQVNHGKTYSALVKRNKIDEDNDMINLELFDFYDSKRGIWIGDGIGFGSMLNLYKKIDIALEARLD